MTAIVGIGPVTAGRLAEVGIDSLETLRRVGVSDAYRRLRFAFGRHVTLNALYGLDALVQGCPAAALSADRRDELRRIHDAIVRELGT